MRALWSTVFLSVTLAVDASCDTEEAGFWSWWNQGRNRCQRPSAGGEGQAAPTGPVLVALGPLLQPEARPREFAALPTRDGAPPFDFEVHDSLDLPGLLTTFRSCLGFSRQPTTFGGFRAEGEGQKHGRLRATLPGYRVGGGGDGLDVGGEGEGLRVRVVSGETLVVQGQRSSGQKSMTFQRSFRLPKSVDVQHIAASYNHTDGALTVNLPAKPGIRDPAREPSSSVIYDSHDGGSHTSITFEQVGRSAPSLRGRPSSPEQEVARLVRHTMDFAESLTDLSPGFLETVKSGDQQSLDKDGSVSQWFPRPALTVRPQRAKPFWRIGATSSASQAVLEVVVPWGLDLGQIEGTQVSIFNATDYPAGKEEVSLSSSGGSLKPAVPRQSLGELQLPAPVKGGVDCTWALVSADTSATADRVLRCQMKEEAVREVQVQVRAIWEL